MTDVLHLAFFGFLAGILGTLLVGTLSRNLQAVVNGIASLVAAVTPTLAELTIGLQTGANVTFGPELSVWIAAAGFLHMLGMLGWYDTVRWWDHLTHTVSAALIATLVYASLRSPSVLGAQVTDVYTAVFTVLFTLGVGVFWEFVELAARELGEHIDRPPVLEYYGLRDTVLDMAFNGVGAVVVVAFDVRLFVPIVEQIPRVAEAVVVGSTVLLFVGALGLGVVLGIVRHAVTDTE
ncbi:hypothetical protein DQW50_03445 [Halorubrum sp. 48-1-W]|uniref:hypothetical protein n=1 Tax=Halorubrum sp. 48-1-W TaxID=2249761 RepID=UPI000DCDDA3B|nr:hypothetical protein [Halorubrum sp. 48-1-W]RAW46623.1 hypothetical protein DQW50_03445 [Halorubrum sp. 48-1-W]